MQYQTDDDGKLIHNTVLNLEPITLDYSPFSLDNISFLNGLKKGWSSVFINTDGLTPEQCLELVINYMQSSDFLNIIKQYIKGNSFPIDAQQTIEKYLKDEREFLLIDKSKLNQVLNNPSKINTLLNASELQIIQQQAFNRNIIQNLSSKLTTSQITEVVKYNLNFIDKTSYQSLYNSGVINQIQQYIETHLDINNEDIVLLIKDELSTILNSHVFLPYETVMNVINSPLNVGTILTKEQFISVLYRAASNLAFISQNDIDDIENLYNKKQYNKIKDIFNSSEIILIMENELNEKKIISNMLTFDQVQQFFNTLKNEFFETNISFSRLDITDDDINLWINAV